MSSSAAVQDRTGNDMSDSANEGYHKTALLIVDVQNDFLPPDGKLAVSNGREILPHIRALLDPKENWPWRSVIASQDYHPQGHVSFITSHPQYADSPEDKLFQVVTVTSPSTGAEVEQIMWPEHCIQGTSGCEIEESIQEALKPWKAKGKYHLIQKGVNKDMDAYSAFASPDTPGARLASSGASSSTSSSSRRDNGTSSSSSSNTPSSHSPQTTTSASSTRSSIARPSDYTSPLASYLRLKRVRRLVITGIATDVCVKATVEDALLCGFQVVLVSDAVKGVDEKASKQALNDFRKNDRVRIVRGVLDLKEALQTLC